MNQKHLEQHSLDKMASIISIAFNIRFCRNLNMISKKIDRHSCLGEQLQDLKEYLLYDDDHTYAHKQSECKNF